MLMKIVSSHYAQLLNGWSDGNIRNKSMEEWPASIPEDIWLLDKDERQEKMDLFCQK